MIFDKFNYMFISPFIANVFLALTFLRTVTAGKEALITSVARINFDGNIDPEMVRYTRRLTIVWGIYFIFAATLCILFMQLQINAGNSAVLNLIFVIMPLSLFFVEYLYRKNRFPDLEHAGPIKVYRIIRHAGLFQKRK